MTKRTIALEVSLAVLIIGVTASVTQLVPLLRNQAGSLNLGATMAQALDQADITADDEFRYVHVKLENNLQLAADQFGNEASSDMQIWGYQRNARLDFENNNINDDQHKMHMLMMAETGIGCMGFDQRYECESWPEINMEPLTNNSTLTINDVRVDDQVISFWTKTPLPENTQVEFSIASSGYSDAGNVIEAGVIEGHKYYYMIDLKTMVPLNREDDLNANTVQFQLESVQTDSQPALESPVFEWNQTTQQVRQLTANDLASAQQQYADKMKANQVKEPSMMDMFLNDGPFSILQRLRDEKVDLDKPLEQNTMQYNGKTAKRVVYAFPVNTEVNNLERYVEIILDPATQTIFEYTLLDEQKGMVSRVTFLENKIVTDQDPATFFTEEYWKNELGLIEGPNPNFPPPDATPPGARVDTVQVQPGSDEVEPNLHLPD